MKYLLIYLLAVSAAISLSVIYASVLGIQHLTGSERRIDCSLVEISPDYSADMKAACRQARVRRL